MDPKQVKVKKNHGKLNQYKLIINILTKAQQIRDFSI